MKEELRRMLSEMKEGDSLILPGIEPSKFDAGFLKALDVPPTQSLMHFMKLQHFKSLLTSGAIRMRRLDRFDGDPHEGQFPSANDVQLSSLAQGFLEQTGMSAAELKSYRDFTQGTKRKLTYVHCWFASDQEDRRMWEEYGDGGRGVCIRTTAQRLKSALGQLPDFSVDLSGVTYSGDEQPIPEVASVLAASRKEMKFKREQEIRLIGQFGQKTWQASYGENRVETPEHQLLKVRFEQLFERVYVGPNASEAEFKEVEELANKAAGSRVVHRRTCDALNSLQT